jgi:hypothetical protein
MGLPEKPWMLPLPIDWPFMLRAKPPGGLSTKSILYQVSSLHGIDPPLHVTIETGASVLGMKQKVDGDPAPDGGCKPRMLLPSPQKKIFEYTLLWPLALKVKEKVVCEVTETSFM